MASLGCVVRLTKKNLSNQYVPHLRVRCMHRAEHLVLLSCLRKFGKYVEIYIEEWRVSAWVDKGEQEFECRSCFCQIDVFPVISEPWRRKASSRNFEVLSVDVEKDVVTRFEDHIG